MPYLSYVLPIPAESSVNWSNINAFVRRNYKELWGNLVVFRSNDLKILRARALIGQSKTAKEIFFYKVMSQKATVRSELSGDTTESAER